MRKMTLFAGMGKWGGLGESGECGLRIADFGLSFALALLAKNPSAERRPVRATPAKPAPISQTNSRRVWPQGKRPGLGSGIESRSFTSWAPLWSQSHNPQRLHIWSGRGLDRQHQV